MIGKYKVITLCGSTRSEIEYAGIHGKEILYLEEQGQEGVIEDHAQAAALLSRAQSEYSDGEYRNSYDAYEKLAHFVCSKKAQEMIDGDRLARLKEDVSRGVAGFATCSNEAVYEKSCELMDLFRNDR